MRASHSASFFHNEYRHTHERKIALMCGLAGLIGKNAVTPALLTAMTDAIDHRGPDDFGHWISDNRQIGLGHRRLSILDLSVAGHQPMVSASERYVIVYNGEIYNHLDLRRELAQSGGQTHFRGHSDTETLLASVDHWGIKATLKKSAGMFAFALWDRKDRTLTLAVDRFGEKPLYYGRTAAGLAFASELKAIRTLPGFDNPIDRKAVRALLARGYVPTGMSIFSGITKLVPGTFAVIDPNNAESPRITRYYDYAAEVEAGHAAPITDHRTALDALDQVLSNAVARQMVADVPVGTFLSGGIDSSLITALAARQSSRPIKTFSIGFDVPGFDEAPHAKAVAAHLGTEHHEMYVSADLARDVIPLLPNMYDEPFGDSSQIPTFLVSQFARSQVTVALTGDAGDELFGGYNRHIEFPRLWRNVARLPSGLRKPALGLAAKLPPKLWNKFGAFASGKSRPAFFGHKVQRTLGIAGQAESFDALVSGFLDEWHARASPVRDAGRDWPDYFASVHNPKSGLSREAQLMCTDALSYLPGDILTKVDRAAMAVSLEGRIPFLDPDVAALAARIPTDMKIVNGIGKLILRDLLYTLVPRELMDRPKAGFAVPVGDWIKTDLREWAEDLLSEKALADGDLLNPAPIRARWSAHLAGREDATQALWPILMLQAWRRG